MATNFRFGSPRGPRARATSGRELENEREVEEFDDTGNIDSDKLLQCPYDKNHQIRASRFPYHLVRCCKNHPKLAKELKICPFNARHRLPEDQFCAHIESCPNRRDPGDSGDKNRLLTWQPPVSTWVNPHFTEDWDEEVDKNPSPFVLGVSATFSEKYPLISISGKLRANTGGDSRRKPSQFPWFDL